ncbi:MAG: hypothetical protein VX762_01190 [Bacteroidota bacterium]|nr:hypothetical protein [Bacteroidota bacterium]MEC9209022.1 hypothetical protein [Bacteroidota bacterium]
MKKLIFIFSIITIISCTKTEEVINIHPPDNTIENITIETYINKLYVSVIGREPTSIELDASFNPLREANLSYESRELVITAIQSNSEYYYNLFRLESLNILNGIDTVDINAEITALTGSELERMLALQEALPKLVEETLEGGIPEMHKRMVNNSFYDKIHMSPMSFVISVFENFIQRSPSDEESESGRNMVIEGQGILFSQSGNSKEDFIDIFFESDAYFMGQTNILFNRYLFRNPSSEESANYSLDYINSRTIEGYKELQTRILSTDEFIGL